MLNLLSVTVNWISVTQNSPQMICASKPVMFITVVRPGISKMTNALMTANLFVTVSIPISGVRTLPSSSTRSTALRILAATSFFPICSNSIQADHKNAVGFAIPCPGVSG